LDARRRCRTQRKRFRRDPEGYLRQLKARLIQSGLPASKKIASGLVRRYDGLSRSLDNRIISTGWRMRGLRGKEPPRLGITVTHAKKVN
jgi:hypothetical protein